MIVPPPASLSAAVFREIGVFEPAQDLVELFAPGSIVESGELLDAGDADDVDDPRHRAQPGPRFAEQAVHVGALHDVGAAGMSPDVARDGLGATLVVVDAQHGRAGLGERVCGRGADALAGAQHDEPAALELEQLEVLDDRSRHLGGARLVDDLVLRRERAPMQPRRQPA